MNLASPDAKPTTRRVDPLTWLLRKFSFVRALERSIRRLEQSAIELSSDRDRAERENKELRAHEAEWTRFSPLGHFYSPLPSRDDVAKAFERGGFGPPFPAVDLNLDGQFALLREFSDYYKELPFPEHPTSGRRFYLTNDSYGPHDACILYCIFRHLHPQRVVEVGSGFSSAAMLDLRETPAVGGFDLTCIDPDFSRLRSLLLPGDADRCTLIEQQVQDVPMNVYAALGPGDILFIDTSHVSKLGSDVNHLFFRVLPTLRAGVWVHIHDVTVNFDYPRHWFDEGRAWNELYLLRAFLMYNRSFQVMYSSALMYNDHHEFLRAHLPICAAGGGGQIWLRKVTDG